jgi:hypothetical protein
MGDEWDLTAFVETSTSAQYLHKQIAENIVSLFRPNHHGLCRADKLNKRRTQSKRDIHTMRKQSLAAMD